MAKKSKDKEAVEVKTSESLAVTYRPKTLDEVRGQESAVAVVKGMKKRGPTGTIILTGPSGVGKTTFARLIASVLNGISGNVEKHPDVRTINAGVQGKVEDIRSLIRSATAAPFTNYKIIIIDEAHKLTGASAEALLVPLEEPPPRTVWILCTTNPEKMLFTVTNRAVKLALNAIPADVIVARLKEIVIAEKIKAIKSKEGAKALKMIAQMSNGSMRDAIAHLENLIFAVAGGSIDFSTEGAMKAYVESAEVDLDKACVSAVAATLNRDLKGMLRAVRLAQNPRGVVHKARILVDNLIGQHTKTVKYQLYTARLFKSIAENMDIKFGLKALVMLQEVITEAELKMNTCSIDEGIILQGALGTFIVENSD